MLPYATVCYSVPLRVRVRACVHVRVCACASPRPYRVPRYGVVVLLRRYVLLRITVLLVGLGCVRLWYCYCTVLLRALRPHCSYYVR